jgi:hypothetical protein
VQPLTYLWAGQELDVALAAHRTSQQQQSQLDNQQQQQQQHKGAQPAPPLGTRCTALRRPLPPGTVAALLDRPAARARAAVRDYARALAPALPAVAVDSHGWLTEAEAAAAAAAANDEAAAAAAARGHGDEFGTGGGAGRRAREMVVMVEVPPSVWVLSEEVHPRWRLSGGRGPAGGGADGEW